MKHFSILSLFATLVATAFLSAPAAAQDMIDPATIPCTTCHDSGTLIVSKQAQFHGSRHGMGEAYLRGVSADCAGCHGSEGAEARIEAGLPPHDASIQGIVNVSPYTCRTCHDIHTTYTDADFSLTGDEAAVQLENTGGTFDGGAGNLCANCHQIRNELPVAANGQIEVADTRFGTHHGVEASMLLGEGGLGVTGSPSLHYRVVKDTCVGCHMGADYNHTYEPAVANCQGCHEGLDTFDREGVQTEIAGMLDEVKAKLIATGIMNDENRSMDPGAYPEAVASAMWNYIFVVEDQSKGVHNPDFAKALLQYGLDNL